jgi:hypothetical protein
MGIVGEAYAEVVLKALVVNPSKTKTQNAILKAYLPKEVKPEDITDMEDLKIDFDVDQDLYYVYQVYDLKPGESVKKSVSIKDVWIIEQDKLDSINAQAAKMAEALKSTGYRAQAQIIKDDIERKTIDIFNKQEQNRNALPQAHIAAYRDNVEILDAIDALLADLDKMSFESQTAKGVVVEKVSVRASWWVIVGVILALAILSAIFFVIWHGQAIKEKQALEAEKEEEEAPPLGGEKPQE